MKLCYVYKTAKKSGLFLYVEKKNNFERVPAALMKQFGKPDLLMALSLVSDKTLVAVDKAELISQLKEAGYYLQLPPKEECLLVAHRKALGLADNPEQHADQAK